MDKDVPSLAESSPLSNLGLCSSVRSRTWRYRDGGACGKTPTADPSRRRRSESARDSGRIVAVFRGCRSFCTAATAKAAARVSPRGTKTRATLAGFSPIIVRGTKRNEIQVVPVAVRLHKWHSNSEEYARAFCSALKLHKQTRMV